MRIATWNVNSIRSRIDRVAAFVERAEIDVLAMQETKCREDQFPALPLTALGYEIAQVGFNQWNGVAIASRVGISNVQVGFAGMPTWGEPATAEARAIGATCGGLRVWSLYIPNGRALDDPHLAYKLDWLDQLRESAATWAAGKPETPIALVGDWNIAPRDEDVWDPAFFAERTHTSPPERAAFQAVLDAGYTDLVRPYTPEPHTFTYWDYTQLRFPKKQGMRIDFILGSPAVAQRVTSGLIDREERKGKGPSDHAPVVIDVEDIT